MYVYVFVRKYGISVQKNLNVNQLSHIVLLSIYLYLHLLAPNIILNLIFTALLIRFTKHVYSHCHTYPKIYHCPFCNNSWILDFLTCLNNKSKRIVLHFGSLLCYFNVNFDNYIRFWKLDKVDLFQTRSDMHKLRFCSKCLWQKKSKWSTHFFIIFYHFHFFRSALFFNSALDVA